MISPRMRASVSSRQSLRARVQESTNWEAGFPAAPAFVGDLDLAADLDDLLARDALLAFDFAAEAFFDELDFEFFISFQSLKRVVEAPGLSTSTIRKAQLPERRHTSRRARNLEAL